MGSYEKFPTVNIEDDNIIGITDCKDSNGNTWYEVPYLGQDTVFLPEVNTSPTNGGFNVPYILRLLRTERRFSTRFLNSSIYQIQFGAGNSGLNDERRNNS